jgi:hypothetical protein
MHLFVLTNIWFDRQSREVSIDTSTSLESEATLKARDYE